MSEPRPAEPVKLIASLFSGCQAALAEAIAELDERYGPVDFVSAPMAFAYTRYYEGEFGPDLIRRFVSCGPLIAPETLPEIKLWTNALEKRLSGQGGRRVNIDPGYISKAHLILATGKGYTHRPYLRDGIYADLTLLYRERAFRPLEWTYPDYADGKVRTMLVRIRERYVEQLRLALASSSEGTT